MSENHGGGSALLQVALLLAGAFLLATIYAMWQIGRDRLYTLGLIFTCAVGATLVLVALAIIVRMWRKNDSPPVIERHFTDGTRTIVKEVKVLDGRAPAQNDIKLLQLPAQGQSALYPELLRAAFQAGRISPHNTSALTQSQTGGDYDPTRAYTEAELPEVGFDDEDGWGGDITLRRP